MHSFREQKLNGSFGLMLDWVAIGLALLITEVTLASNLLAPAVEALGSYQRRFTWGEPENGLLLFQVAVVPALLYVLGQYEVLSTPRANWSFNRVVLAVGLSFLVLLGLVYSFNQHRGPRLTLGLDFLLVILLSSSWRHMYRKRSHQKLKNGDGLANVLIFGVSEISQSVAAEIAADPLTGRRIVGIITSEGEKPVKEAAEEAANKGELHNLIPVQGIDLIDWGNAMDSLGAEEVMIGPEVQEQELETILGLCQERAIGVHLIPNHFASLGIQPRPWQLGKHTLLDIHSRPISSVGWYAKRGLDILAGTVGLVLLSPIILACVIAIKVEMPHEKPFYGGRRVGLKGRQFKQWKFSTMDPDADDHRENLQQKNAREGPWFQLEEEDDPRITKVGAFLRKYSLNDIPQFWNVVKGDMSLVGPRPLATDEVARFTDYDFRYFRIFDVKPGITGLWQISDRMNPSFDYRVEKDTSYIKQWSFWLDLKIILMTPWAMLKGGR